jgi:hypothetical protein
MILQSIHDRIEALRLDMLFGNEEVIDNLNTEAAHHFLIAITLVNQAALHIKLAEIHK